jgi:acyl-CoA thioester hydrolase
VRYAETDAMGVVHHAAYVTWLELARTEWMRQRGQTYADFERSGFALPVTELNVRYVSPCRYDDLVVVRGWVEEVRSRLIRFRYEVLGPGGELLLTASTGHICTTAAGRVTAMPRAIRDLAAGADGRSPDGGQA